MSEGILVFIARQIWHTAAEEAKRALEAVEANPSAGIDIGSLQAIVFSAMTVEAFVNELSEYLVVSTQYPTGANLDEPVYHTIPGLEQLQHLGIEMRAMERDRASTIRKVLHLSKSLGGTQLSRGSRPFQDYHVLSSTRNILVHPKPANERRHCIVMDFHQRAKRLRDYGKYTHGPGWFTELQVAPVAAWSCVTAWEIVNHLIQQLQETLNDHHLASFILRGPATGFWDSARERHHSLWSAY